MSDLELNASDTRSVTSTRISDCLIVTVPDDLGGSQMDLLREATLNAIHGVSTRAVIFELSGLRFLDSAEFSGLKSIAHMTERLGSSSIFVGLHPGIVAHLVQADADLGGIKAELGLSEALGSLSVGLA
jgi:anti-anti-sigma regulatory factor